MSPRGAPIALVGGRVVPADRARVALLDRGFLLGDGLFETLRSRSGRPLLLEPHAKRLRDGLRVLGMDAALEDAFRDAAARLARAGARRVAPETVVRVNITPGRTAGVADAHGEPQVTGTCRPLTAPYGAATRSGVRVTVASPRKWAGDPLSCIKHLSYLPHVQARREAHAASAHEGILRNQHGRLAEGATSNLFALRSGVVHAPGPSEGALPGVTRATVLGRLHADGVPVTSRLTAADLAAAEEAWLTNTTGGVVPVVQVDGTRIGDGRPGPVTRRLAAAHRKTLESEAEP